MANKAAIIQSDLSTEQKVLGLLMCLAQEKKVEMTRLLQPFNLSLIQLQLLHNLSYGPDEGLTVNQLKATMIDESPNVSRALNKLVDAGYVIKQRNDTDQRIVRICITDTGRQAHIDADKQIVSVGFDLPEKQLQQLYQTLKQL